MSVLWLPAAPAVPANIPAWSCFVQLHSITGPQMVLRGLSGLGQKQGAEVLVSKELMLASVCVFWLPFSAGGVYLLVHVCALNPGVGGQGGLLWSLGSDMQPNGV